MDHLHLMMREYVEWYVMFRDKMLLSVVCMQVLHTLSCRIRKKWFKRLRRDSNWIWKKRLRTPYAYNMNRAILQSVSRNFILSSIYYKKKVIIIINVKQMHDSITVQESVFRLGPFEINVKFVITIVSL